MSKPLTQEQVASRRRVVDDCGCPHCGEVEPLLTTVEAQAEVIQRLRSGWLPFSVTVIDGVRHEWRRAQWNADDDVQPMPRGHVLVLGRSG